MTTLFIDGEPLYLDGPPGPFVPLAEADAMEGRIAALVAERDGLAQQLFDLDAQLDRLSDQLYLEKQANRNQHEVNAILARDCKKAKKALQQIAAGNPAKPGQWLTDVEMAEIARTALGGKADGKTEYHPKQ